MRSRSRQIFDKTESKARGSLRRKILYPDRSLSEKLWESINEIIKNTDINVHVGKNFSTDTIFAQFAHLDEFINMGCNTIEIEMETAALF